MSPSPAAAARHAWATPAAAPPPLPGSRRPPPAVPARPSARLAQAPRPRPGPSLRGLLRSGSQRVAATRPPSQPPLPRGSRRAEGRSCRLVRHLSTTSLALLPRLFCSRSTRGTGAPRGSGCRRFKPRHVTRRSSPRALLLPPPHTQARTTTPRIRGGRRRRGPGGNPALGAAAPPLEAGASRSQTCLSVFKSVPAGWFKFCSAPRVSTSA